ncbi:hypothetical protein Syn7803US13_66 [Synechococcus phage ACG-2014f]|uniref:Uncharacterized protein n=3 Tax=Atlauavirus TaxID=2733092 RepID=A0A0E3FHC7_9CAUD|nr:hypothetical protein HOQ62_gp068 [Synechococcus phage ACG-2014f_Syn7803C8]YP_009778793.1 hypothetical protein HOQ63_gp066 [Synechococcus phage ACG-2014f_Syn7803US26]AIX27426.1 hypothetical protein Syn7803US13_66 [Synechococcus phage ACG-2014f]AIX21392.1 hypothetical protein Syn7803C8_68 [Synechococcus phage ACG-2014f_Syn7803C8]AIX28919.1 hypothetical protein Syn7803US26_66 [Synechococcus phage ACG-2014f_Syn7803US26]AIX29463.1 hypothetical protein Syn7803US30_67 [Synechococcus phage ACG-2014
MAIFSEEFTNSIKSKVDSVKDKFTGINIGKQSVVAIVGGTLVFSTLAVGAVGATVRQVVGSNMAKQCNVAVGNYVELAEVQETELVRANGYIQSVLENPWSALVLGARMSEMADEMSARWDEIGEADDNYLEACVPDSDFKQWVFGGYVEADREAKWEAESTLEDTRQITIKLSEQLG